VRLPKPTQVYDQRDQTEVRLLIERADDASHKRNEDIEVGNARLILKSPNGTRYSITVNNSGAISAAAI
jgi:hypothetical protein